MIEAASCPPQHVSLLALAREERDARRRRQRIFRQELLADPSWDLLMDLFIARQEGRRLSISSACLSAPVPTGTALRCIEHLADVGLVSRVVDGESRSLYLVPTDRAIAKLTVFFTQREQDAGKNAA